MKDLRFFSVHDVNSTYFQECLAIYHQAFPENERQADAVIINRVNDGVCSLIAGEANGKVICFALLWIFAGTGFVFVDYFAVAHFARGKAIGAQLLAFLSKKYNAASQTLVFEVEHPAFGENQEERMRRIRFYERGGAVLLNNTRYLLPPLQTSSQPMEMKLMFLGGPHLHAAPGKVQSLITRIYQEVYGRAADDHLLSSFV